MITHTHQLCSHGPTVQHMGSILKLIGFSKHCVQIQYTENLLTLYWKILPQNTESMLRVGGVAVLTCGGWCGDVERTTPGAS